MKNLIRKSFTTLLAYRLPSIRPCSTQSDQILEILPIQDTPLSEPFKYRTFAIPEVAPEPEPKKVDHKEAVLNYAKRNLVDVFDEYKEKRLKWEHVEDLIQTSMMQKPELRVEIEELLRNSEKETWIQKLDDYSEGSKEEVKWHENYEADHIPSNSKSFSFPNQVRIKFFDNFDEFYDFFNLMIYDPNQKQVVGLDAEWTPFSYGKKLVGATIMQMAFENFVLILDIERMDRIKLTEFLNSFFNDESYVKIGHVFSNDILQIKKALKNFSGNKEKIIDIGNLLGKIIDAASKKGEEHVNMLKNEYNLKDEDIKMIDERIKQSNDLCIRLGSLCEMLLGSELEKGEMRSVWNRRPLRPSQLHYAALDAYVLLMLYKVCESMSIKVDLDLEQSNRDDFLRALNHHHKKAKSSQEKILKHLHEIEESVKLEKDGVENLVDAQTRIEKMDRLSYNMALTNLKKRKDKYQKAKLWNFDILKRLHEIQEGVNHDMDLVESMPEGQKKLEEMVQLKKNFINMENTTYYMIKTYLKGGRDGSEEHEETEV